MIETLAVERYARALFGLAKNRKELAQVEADLLHALQIVEKYPEISNLVLNSTISRTEKEDFIDKIFPSGTSSLVIQFLKVLIKKHRFKELGAIQKKFHAAYEKDQNIQEVVAITAVPISKNNEEKLRSVLKQKLRSEIILTTKTDPEIIGGFILHFNGTEINGSYRDRLENIKQRLMK